MFFSEEKNQKTFTFSTLSRDRGYRLNLSASAKKTKVFWFFSSEKNIFLS